MEFSLAKKLKDAGFPFKRSLFESLNSDTPIGLDEHGVKGVAQIPTLPELIDACGDDFHELRIQHVGGKRFYACGGHIKNRDKWIFSECYETPEESVADIWLQINSFK